MRDAQAFAIAYDVYGTTAYSLMRRITGNHGTAEDLLQELFLRIWRSIGKYDCDKGAFEAWLLTIARNMAIDYLRSSPARLAMRFRPFTDLPARRFAAESARYWSALESADLVRRAFSSLTSNQRAVLELAYFEGCSQTEIALRLEQPLGTVKSWMRAALTRMQAAVSSRPGNMVPMSPTSRERTKTRPARAN